MTRRRAVAIALAWAAGATVYELWGLWAVPVLLAAGGLTGLVLWRIRQEREEERSSLTPTRSVSMDWLRSLAAKEPGVTALLEELESLRRDGTITEAEHERRRREIVQGL